MKVYVLQSFGGQWEDAWEEIEGVFASFEAMEDFIKNNPDYKTIGNVPLTLKIHEVVGDYHNNHEYGYYEDNFQGISHFDDFGLKFEQYSVIGVEDAE